MITRHSSITLSLALGGVATLALLWLIGNSGAPISADAISERPPSSASPIQRVAIAGTDGSERSEVGGAGEATRSAVNHASDGNERAGVLGVTKVATPDPVQAGAPLTYTIRVTNSGDMHLHVSITDILPLHITTGSTQNGTAILPGGRLTWTANLTAPGGVWTHSFVVTVERDYAGPLTNVVKVTAEGSATSVYTETSTSMISHPLYLPFVLRNAPGIRTITGEYLLIGTPCTTDPCLPGMVYAVLVDETYYYLTIGGSWLWLNRAWDGYTPEVGDVVTVAGYVEDMIDIFGAPFHNIEVVSLKPAASPPPVKWGIVVVEVHSYGEGEQEPDEYVEIRNDNTHSIQLDGWTLRNARDRVFTFPSYLMQPGEVCRIYTNEKHPEWCAFTYGSESAIWNSANDCAYLRDNLGTLVDSHCYCEGHTAAMTISATDATLTVGEGVTITATLFNYGCVGLGLPQYRLYVRSDETHAILDPENPDPVVHYLAVAPGRSDAQEFTLQAVGVGQARLNATASFEVHLGYPGPAYWSASGTGPLTITVTP